MAKKKDGSYQSNSKRVTTIGRSTNSRPSKKKCKWKNGVKKYRGQGK